MTMDLLDRRILAGIRIVDGVTGLPVKRTLNMTAPGVRVFRNRSGDYLIAGAPGLESHTTAFPAPPIPPPIGSIAVTITMTDSGGEYLPRSATVNLPRDPDPANADEGDSLFRPVDIPIYPAPAATLAPGWSVVRVTVIGATPSARLPGALLRIVQVSDNEVLGRGVADSRGEALIALPGIPITTFNSGVGPVLSTDIAARVEVIPSPAPAQPTNPDLLDAQPVLKSALIQLISGKSLHLTL